MCILEHLEEGNDSTFSGCLAALCLRCLRPSVVVGNADRRGRFVMGPLRLESRSFDRGKGHKEAQIVEA